VKRIAIIGHAGTISLDAIRWLHDVKIPLVHLDTDGRVLALVVPDSPDQSALRRAQARAVDSEVGLAIMRDLLRQKLDGQERVLRAFTCGQLALPHMELGRRALARATDFISLRSAEAHSAAAYWAAWGGVRVEFPAGERDRVPRYWQTFGHRASALSGSPRLAVNPANALLNYLYAILET
jgi:CRISPR-associated protein Cas1